MSDVVVVKKRMTDSKKLERLYHTTPKGRVQLFEQFSRPSGRFCDASGNLEPFKVRHVYMLAGIIPPKEDSEMLQAIGRDVALLNAFLEHSGTRDTRKRSPRKKHARSPKRNDARNEHTKKPL